MKKEITGTSGKKVMISNEETGNVFESVLYYGDVASEFTKSTHNTLKGAETWACRILGVPEIEHLENEMLDEVVTGIKNQMIADQEMTQFGTKVHGGFSMNGAQMLAYLNSKKTTRRTKRSVNP